jgi:RNA polymerase sigma-70 factor (ECF subfamily)
LFLIALKLKDPAAIEYLQSRIAAGDEQAYRELFLTFYNKLINFSILFVKNKELAEEVVSDVFINVWRRRDKIQAISNLGLYLYISAKNISLNYLSRINRQSHEQLDEMEVELQAPFTNPEDVFITKEMNLRLKAAIEELPPRCKLIFKLLKEDRLSYKEVAGLLNLSASTVENQLSIAVKKIATATRYSLKKHNFL